MTNVPIRLDELTVWPVGMPLNYISIVSEQNFYKLLLILDYDNHLFDPFIYITNIPGLFPWKIIRIGRHSVDRDCWLGF